MLRERFIGALSELFPTRPEFLERIQDDVRAEKWADLLRSVLGAEGDGAGPRGNRDVFLLWFVLFANARRDRDRLLTAFRKAIDTHGKNAVDAGAMVACVENYANVASEVNQEEADWLIRKAFHFRHNRLLVTLAGRNAFPSPAVWEMIRRQVVRSRRDAVLRQIYASVEPQWAAARLRAELAARRRPAAAPRLRGGL
jgi:hypothetical protein